jgi:hypothetical protein
VVLDMVLSSLDLEALIMSSSSFFLSFLCNQGHLFCVHCFFFSQITFSKGRFVVQVFSSSSCFSSTSFFFISWYLSSSSSTFLSHSASFSLLFSSSDFSLSLSSRSRALNFSSLRDLSCSSSFFSFSQACFDGDPFHRLFKT